MTLADLALSHYSDHPVIEPTSITQGDEPFTFEKPIGLWVSVDGPDDWASWCEREEFRDTSAQHRHRITLAPDADVLHLATVEQILAFHEEYSQPDPFLGRMRGIRWSEVAERHQGIVIAPYQWSLRFTGPTTGTYWYYPWDCASGCLWDAGAIKEITLMNPDPDPDPDPGA